MKIIDILVSKANGTLEDGFEFRFKNRHYSYDKERNAILSDSQKYLGLGIVLENFLNTEVEVIEQNKDIEELEPMQNFSNNNVIEAIEVLLSNRDKINELVREVNKLKNK